MGCCFAKPMVDEAFLAPAVLKGLENIDLGKLKKLIQKGHLAPCYEGVDEGNDELLEECPICFLHYPALNTSDCCTQRICTECILKVQVSTMDPWPCPFCKSPDYTVKFTGPKSKHAREKDRLEQQKVQEARERERQDEILRDQQRELERIQAQQQKTATIEPSTPDNTTTALSGVMPLFASTNPFEDHRLTAAPAALAATPTPGPAPVSSHGVSAAAAVMRLAEESEARIQAHNHRLEWAALQHRLGETGPAPQGWLQNHVPAHMLGLHSPSQMEQAMLEQALHNSLSDAPAVSTPTRSAGPCAPTDIDGLTQGVLTPRRRPLDPPSSPAGSQPPPPERVRPPLIPPADHGPETSERARRRVRIPATSAACRAVPLSRVVAQAAAAGTVPASCKTVVWAMVLVPDMPAAAACIARSADSRAAPAAASTSGDMPAPATEEDAVAATPTPSDPAVATDLASLAATIPAATPAPAPAAGDAPSTAAASAPSLSRPPRRLAGYVHGAESAAAMQSLPILVLNPDNTFFVIDPPESVAGSMAHRTEDDAHLASVIAAEDARVIERVVGGVRGGVGAGDGALDAAFPAPAAERATSDRSALASAAEQPEDGSPAGHQGPIGAQPGLAAGSGEDWLERVRLADMAFRAAIQQQDAAFHDAIR